MDNAEEFHKKQFDDYVIKYNEWLMNPPHSRVERLLDSIATRVDVQVPLDILPDYFLQDQRDSIIVASNLQMLNKRLDGILSDKPSHESSASFLESIKMQKLAITQMYGQFKEVYVSCALKQ